jgi:hypothetical protein
VSQAQYWLTKAQVSGHKRASVELKKLLAAISKQPPGNDLLRAAPGSQHLDVIPPNISESERRRSYQSGIEKGRKCALRGVYRYKQRVAWRSRSGFPDELDLPTILDAMHDLSLDSAEKEGYLDSDSEYGIEEICDGSDPSVASYKAAFIEGIIVDVKMEIYGEEEPEIG